MQQISIELRTLLDHLNDKLSVKFPGEQFLYQELDGIIQALVNFLRSTVLDTAEMRIKMGELGAIKVLNTYDHFCSIISGQTEEILDTGDVVTTSPAVLTERENIIDEIIYTSGLDREMADYGLSAIEKMIDETVSRDPNLAVNVQYIGLISSPEFPGYRINLSSELQFAPQSSTAGADPRLLPMALSAR